jgi:HAE1 family hydrophobic/amphiphilic exporter-1
MAEAGTVAVILPGAFYTLRETVLPPIELLRRHRVRMAVATDCNPGTAPMASLPLAIGGAFVALVVGDSSFSISSLIGVLMLMGIAAKNSILLVDYIVMAEKDGMPRLEAILDAAHKRARPILMTTFAMGAGMLPVAIGWGADVEFRQPMAIAVVGGLISSTFLSLLFIPPIFTIVDDVAGFLRRRLGRMFAGQRDLPGPVVTTAE